MERLDERREVLERVSRVARRWRMIGASRAFREWADVSAQRSRKRQLMQRFAYRALNADVARAWATWQERTREHKLMQLVLARHLNGLLFKTFVAWHYLMRSRGGGGRISRFGRWYEHHHHTNLVPADVALSVTLALALALGQVLEYRARDGHVAVGAPAAPPTCSASRLVAAAPRRRRRLRR